MAIVQISKIQVRTGAHSDLPQLDIGELGFAVDTKTVHIGNDPILDPPVGIEPTLTQLLTNSPDCIINASQVRGVLTIPVDSLKVTGGTNGQILQTDGSGTLSWITGSGGGGAGTNPGGANTQIQFNNSGSFSGTTGLTFDKASNVLSISGNITATNIIGTLLTATQTNITRVGTLANLTTIANGNINLGGELKITNNNQHGGGDYAGMITLTTSINGATNTSKFIRLNKTGGLEILNNAYSSTIFTITDSGNVLAGSYFIGDGRYLTNINAVSVSVLNSLVVDGITNLGPVGNLKLLGGTNGQVLKTDGTGNLSWTTIVAGNSNAVTSYGNSDVDLRIASYTGNVAKAVLAYSIDGINVNGTVGNANIAITSGTVTTNAQPNITSVGKLTTLIVGNTSTYTTFGNGIVTAAGNIAAGKFVGNGFYLTNINASTVVGNVPYSLNANYANVAGTATIVPWTGVSSTPNTIAGFGITDAHGPAFTATITTSKPLDGTAGSRASTLIVYDTVTAFTSEGGYNNATGFFGAPKSGYYLINASVITMPTSWTTVPSYSSAGSVVILKNNNPISEGSFASLVLGLQGASSPSSASTMVYLNKDDLICVKFYYSTTAPNGFWNITTSGLTPGAFSMVWLRP